jgi:hypothetical protein
MEADHYKKPCRYFYFITGTVALSTPGTSFFGMVWTASSHKVIGLCGGNCFFLFTYKVCLASPLWKAHSLFANPDRTNEIKPMLLF